MHLQLRGFSVFLDVERLEAGKFDYNLLSSIRQAKYFLLVLTPSALDRCLEDNEQKDWVHRVIIRQTSCRCRKDYRTHVVVVKHFSTAFLLLYLQEIVQALQTKCNIIPIMESFQWPDLEKLPEDMRPICYFNGIRYGSISSFVDFLLINTPFAPLLLDGFTTTRTRVWTSWSGSCAVKSTVS